MGVRLGTREEASCEAGLYRSFSLHWYGVFMKTSTRTLWPVPPITVVTETKLKCPDLLSFF